MIELVRGEGGRLWDGPWAALLDDDRLIGFACDEGSEAMRVGDVHVGRLRRVDRGAGVGFVELAGGIDCMLDLPRDGKRLQEGALLAMQVRRLPRGEKLAKLSTRIRFDGADATITVKGPDSSREVERTGDADATVLLERLTRLADATEAAIAEATTPARVVRGRDCVADLLHRFPDMKPIAVRCATRAGTAFVARALETDPVGIGIEVAHAAPRDWRFAPATIEEMLEEALARRLPLAGGGSLLIEPVETLTAIDVNAGAASSAAGPERVAVATNMAAADAIARQVRLLNLSGALVIDFVGMRARGRQRELIDRLRAAFAGDPTRPWIGGLSPIGLVEMSRRYLGPDLYERFGQRAD